VGCESSTRRIRDQTVLERNVGIAGRATCFGLGVTCPAMHGFVVDLRHSLRGFRRDAGFTALAVLALAIGVGSSTAMFSIVEAVLVRPLPYAAPDRLLLLTALDGEGQRVPMGPAEYLHLAQNAKTIEAIGVFAPGSATVASSSGAAQVRAVNLSASLFATLGIAPARGRAFDSAEDFAGTGPWPS
jgi:putative ABC transport system permease protein